MAQLKDILGATISAVWEQITVEQDRAGWSEVHRYWIEVEGDVCVALLWADEFLNQSLLPRDQLPDGTVLATQEILSRLCGASVVAFWRSTVAVSTVAEVSTGVGFFEGVAGDAVCGFVLPMFELRQHGDLVSLISLAQSEGR